MFCPAPPVRGSASFVCIVQVYQTLQSLVCVVQECKNSNHTYYNNRINCQYIPTAAAAGAATSAAVPLLQHLACACYILMQDVRCLQCLTSGCNSEGRLTYWLHQQLPAPMPSSERRHCYVQGWILSRLDTLPLGVALPLKEALQRCKPNPPSGTCHIL